MKILSTLLMFLSISLGTAYAQKTITGTVTDDANETIIGASVLVKGTMNGTITEVDGTYKITVSDTATTLVFSYVGYTTKEIKIEGKVIDAMLLEGIEMEKIVVTALGISRKEKSLGYATQSIDGDALTQTRDANVVNSLQGKIAGVQITGSSNLGGSSRILLRGASSIKGQNQPLFVIDGVPLDNSNFAARDNSSTGKDQQRGGGGYDYGNAIQDINPDDIESVNVLKGPAATALYGNRGANGVIMITTKKGKMGKKGKSPIGVTISSGFQFNEVAVLPNYQNQYGGGAGDVFSTSTIDTNQKVVDFGYDGSWGPKFGDQQVRQWDSYDDWDNNNYGKTRAWKANPNNIKDFFRTGLLATNNISFNGANETGAFRLSYTNTHQIGTQVNSGLDRHNIGFNGNHKFTDKLSANVSVNFVATEANGRPLTGYSESIMSQFNQWFQRQADMSRLRNYKNPDGTQRTWNRKSEQNGAPNYWDNPFWERYENGERDRRERMFGQVGLTYKINDFLSVSTRAMTDFYTDRREEWVAKGGVRESKYSETVRFVRENNYEAMLKFNKRFGEDLSIAAFVGTNFRRNVYSRNGASSQGGLNTVGLYNLGNSVSGIKIDDYNEEQEIFSSFANANIGFKDFLYLDLSYRFDINSTLPVGKNLYNYYSLSGSFIFSEFIPKNKVLTFGKLRVGYASAGNGTTPYNLNNTYITNPSYGNNGLATVPNALNNSNLKPEIKNSFETGLDLKFLDNKLGLDVTYYNEVTTNQIFNVAASAATGYTSRWINAGKVLNHGVEATVYYNPIKTKDFNWDLGINFAKNYNTVLALAEGTDNIRLASLFGVSLEARIGETYGTFYGYDYVRDANNNKLVNSANGRYVRTDEVVALGSVLADFTGGVSNTFTWKGISLYVSIDFQGGGKIFSLSNQWGKNSGILEETVMETTINGTTANIREQGIIVDGVAATQDADGNWVSDGTANSTVIGAQSHFFYNQGYVLNAADIYDASFVKLREMRLSYAFPKSVFAKTPFRSVRLSIVGRNIAILHKNVPNIDPEAGVSSGNIQGFEGGQLPTERSVGFNLSLKF